MELFLRDLAVGSAAVATKENARVISASHVKNCIHNTPLFDFLADVCANIIEEDREKKERGRKKQKEPVPGAESS